MTCLGGDDKNAMSKVCGPASLGGMSENGDSATTAVASAAPPLPSHRRCVAPSIEESVDMDAPLPCLMDRYYESWYLTDYRGARHDYRLLVHSNGLVVTLLAPSHQLVHCRDRIVGINFQVTVNTNRLDNQASGKRKHGAQRLTPESPMFRVQLSPAATDSCNQLSPAAANDSCNQLPLAATTSCDKPSRTAAASCEQLVVPACVQGKLVQLNSRLSDGCVGCLVDGLEDGSGYIAVIQPGRAGLEELYKRAVDTQRYRELVCERITADV